MNAEAIKYLHLYTGTEVAKANGKDIQVHTLIGVYNDGKNIKCDLKHRGLHLKEDVPLDTIALLLRPLVSITQAELKEIFLIVFKRHFPLNGGISYLTNKGHGFGPRFVLSSGLDRLGFEIDGYIWADTDLSNRIFNQHKVTIFLLKQGFDLFNLLPQGAALDKTKL